MSNLATDTLLHWSETYYTKAIDDCAFGCDVIIDTAQLSQFSQEENYDYREKLMYQISQKGISNKDISDYQNKQQITKRGERHTTRLVWVIIQKYKNKQTEKIISK